MGQVFHFSDRPLQLFGSAICFTHKRFPVKRPEGYSTHTQPFWTMRLMICMAQKRSALDILLWKIRRLSAHCPACLMTHDVTHGISNFECEHGQDCFFISPLPFPLLKGWTGTWYHPLIRGEGKEKMDPWTSFCSKNVCTVSCSGRPFYIHKSETHFVVIYFGMRCVVPESHSPTGNPIAFFSQACPVT